MRTRMGSPDTVAPEVVRGEPYHTPVDCWAAGPEALTLQQTWFEQLSLRELSLKGARIA